MKKLVSILLALAMLFALVACNGGTANDGATPTPSDATPTEAEQVDYTEGGKYMNIPGSNGNDAWKLPAYTFPKNTVEIMSNIDQSQGYTENLDKFKAFRDGYQLKVEANVVAAADALTKYMAACMSNDAPDIFQNSFQPSLVNKGYAQAWDEYIDFSIGLWDDLRDSVEMLRFKDKIYSVQADHARWDNALFYNVELFDELGLKTPTEYYEEGNWTWDTMRELAMQATIDENGDGMPEVYGIAWTTGVQFVYSTGTSVTALDSSSELGAVNNTLSSDVARAITFCTDLLTKDNCAISEGDLRADFAAGKIAMYSPYAYWYCFSWGDMMREGKLALVPFPKDPEADKYYVMEFFGAYYLGPNCENPQGAAAWVQSLIYDSLNKAEFEDVEKTDEERLEEGGVTKAIADMITDMMYSEDKTPILYTDEMFRVTDYYGDLWFMPQTGEPWSAIAEYLSPMIDEKLQTAMEG